MPFTGNAGVRMVTTNTRSNGFSSTNGGALEAVSLTNDYSEALPSANLTFELAENKLLRVGVARVIARPPLDELRASRSLWNQTPPPTGNGGNPLLDPFVANQADVSYEWYFKPRSAGVAGGVLQGRRTATSATPPTPRSSTTSPTR